MLAKLPFLFKQSAWLLALLIMTSALPASAQEEDEDVIMQEGQFNFEYSNELNGYIISPDKYGGFDWDMEFQLYVPSTRLQDGKPVVGLSGFESLKELREIIFPEENCHVKYICDNCFKYCHQLGAEDQVLNLPESVETIGHYAFYSCTGLRSVNLSSKLKSIGVSAFELCKSLESITLPKSLKVIREYAFRNCANFDHWGNFIGGGLESVVFEDGVDFYTNDVYCFYNHVFWGCANLSSVKLPNGTPGRFIIPMGTFGYCGNLKSIEFPTNTGKIEQMAFYRSGIERLDLTKIELEKPFYLQGYYTFAACENLKTVTAKGKVRFDGLYTFQDCKALETVTFTGSGDDYTVMNPDIFKYCDNLKSVKFYRLKGNGQDNDMDSVFTDCTSLVSITSECPPEISKIGYSCFDGCTSLTTISLPQTEFLINETAFRGCTALEEFDFTNVTSIGKGSFKGCTSLASTPNTSAVTTIGEGSFEGCTGLTSLDFENLTSIGTKAFTDCSALKSINFNSSSETPITVSIGSQAFTGCSVLETISFKTSSYNPPTVANEDAFDASHYATTVIDVLDEKFQDFVDNKIWCKFDKLKHPAMFAYEYDEATGTYSVRKGKYALESDFVGMFEIPEQYNSADVVAIEANAFQNLDFISGITLHDKLTSIGADAFYGCKDIGTVVNKSATPLECDASIFDDEVYTDATLYVPFGSLDAYKNTLPWSKFATIKQGLGVRMLYALKFPDDSGVFNQSFDLTLTNPNGPVGTIYYYIVPQSKVRVATENEVHDVLIYTEPIKIASSCTVVAYVSDGTYCCEPVSKEYTRVYVSTENGLDKVLSANDNEEYIINTALFGHYHDGTYLYASTKGNSGSSKNTFNEDKKSEEFSDNEEEFIQEDWVAIADLTSDYVGQEIESGNLATVLSNTDYPVISFNEDVSSAEGKMGINTFRVENFNIHAENAAVSNIWLVAPQPAEYCSVKGYVKTANVNAAEGYLVLQSAESATTTENDTESEPLTMNVYYDPATITLGDEGLYSFTGIVSKESDALKFTALTVTGKPTGIEDVDAGTTRIVAANGNINVAADKQTTIAVYSANGQLITAIEASSATIAVTPGFYIVKVGNQVTKLAVR